MPRKHRWPRGPRPREEETRVDHSDPSPQPEVRIVGATLSVYQDDDVWRLYYVGASGGVLGRGGDADFLFDDATISRRQARITLVGNGFLIEDLGSSNGTFVDGKRVAGPRVLPMRCSVRLGKHTNIRFASVDQHEQEGEYQRVLTDERLRLEREKNRALSAQAAELRRANDDLAQFLSVASHDLREPLQTVRSYMELFRKRYGSQVDDRGVRYLQFAGEGAERMERMMEDLLRYIRVGRDDAAAEAVDLGEVAREVIADLDRSIRRAGAQVAFDELPTVRGHRTQLRQLLQNLIGNAIKFRGDSPVRVRIEGELVEDLWRISVRDNGIGIDTSQGDRVFELFHRLHTREEYPGTGLGLTIARKVVDYHGGEIWFDSIPGEGTTFHFTLPTGDGPGDDEDREHHTLD